MANPNNPSLAMAYSISKSNKRKKKMANGGEISAASEKRPMPDQMHDDSKQANMASNKPAKNDSWTDRSTVAQAQKPSKTTLKHPRMVPSNTFSVRLRDQEDDLEMSAKPNNGPQEQPPKEDNESDPKKRGQAPHPMKMMAEGGMINKKVSMKSSEMDNLDEPEGLQEDDDMMSPSEKEIMADHFADGGMIDDQPEPEAEDEQHDSLVSAIMAKRQKMAEGGQVDIDSNNEEQPNEYYDRNENAALKENYDSDMDDVSQPMDSNEHDHHIISDLHDMVEKIRVKMNRKRSFR